MRNAERVVRVGVRSLAIRYWQLISGFIFSPTAKSLVVPLLVALFPIALTLLIVRRNWTSVPFRDEWWTPGKQIASLLHRTLGWRDLFSQGNESRKLFPKLYYLGLVAVTGRWDAKDAMVLMFALACLGSVLLFVLLCRTTTFSLPGRLWTWAFLNFVLFCPAQYKNFLWGIQLEPLTPGVALLAALTINLSQLRFGLKILANAALAFLATYSYAHGMLLWALAIPIYHNSTASRDKNSIWNVRAWYAFYAFVAALSVVWYFHHYRHPKYTPPFATSLSDALPLAHFLSVWLGNLFAFPALGPFFFGCFFLTVFAALAVVAIRVARCRGSLVRFYPWIVIAAYALLSGAVTASGRLRWGTSAALVFHYAPVSVFFYIGLAGLALNLFNAWGTGSYQIKPRLAFASGLIAIGLPLGLFAAGWLDSFTRQLADLRVFCEEHKDLALAVEWIPAIPNNPTLWLAGYSPENVVKRAIPLSKYGVLRPRLIPESLACAVRDNPPVRDRSAGILGSARFSNDHLLLLTGFAWLPYRNARADCVVVGYENSNGGLTPLTVFPPTYKRQSLKGRFDFKCLPPNGFAAVVDPANIPTGTVTLRAWAVDMRTAHALPMAGAITVYNELVQKN